MTHVKPVKFPFHSYYSMTSTANLAGVFLAPSTLSTRIGGMADLYALFRWHSLKYRLVKNVAEVNLVGITESSPNTLPSTAANIGEMRSVTASGSLETYRTPWVDIPQEILRGALPWYKALYGSEDSWNEYPCALYAYTQGATSTTLLEFDGVAEFKGMIAPANNPMVRVVVPRTPTSDKPPSAQSDLVGPASPWSLASKSLGFGPNRA